MCSSLGIIYIEIHFFGLNNLVKYFGILLCSLLIWDYSLCNLLFFVKIFLDGFTYLISIMFLVVGLAYGIGAKTIKSDKEIIEKASVYLKDVGYLCAIIFFAAQFIAMFKESNIGTLVVAFISSIIRMYIVN